MESVAALRSFSNSSGLVPIVWHSREKPSIVPAYNSRWISPRPYFHGLTSAAQLSHFPTRRDGMLVSCAKTSASTEKSNSDVSLNGCAQQAIEKKTVWSATFPTALEELILDVCDETEVAELKLKIGDFEMHLKRNIAATVPPMSNISPATSPPTPSEPMVTIAPEIPPTPPPQSSPGKSNPFMNVFAETSSKLTALNASGASGYVLVPSPMVGSFRRGRLLKGKRLPPSYKEGDVIKQGQVVGYVDQFGGEKPVKSDVGGLVVKILSSDGEAVGFGDPIIAVIPYSA